MGYWVLGMRGRGDRGLEHLRLTADCWSLVKENHGSKCGDV